MNEITLTLSGLNQSQAQSVLSHYANVKGDKPVTAEARETKVTRATETKTKKGKVNAKAALAADDAEDLLDDEEIGEEVEASDDEEMVEEDEAEELDEDLSEDEDAEEEISKAQVQAAFKKHMKNFKVKGKVDVAAGRKSAIKILKTVKAKSVDEIKPKDFAKVMELLEG